MGVSDFDLRPGETFESDTPNMPVSQKSRDTGFQPVFILIT
jgi:hypothetical protein